MPLPLEAYRRAADGFLANQSADDLSESVAQNTQQRITEDSLTVLRRRTQGFTAFGEMMIVYEDSGRLRHVTPHNAIVLGDDDSPHRTSWNWEHEPLRMLAVLEYLPETGPRGDFGAAFRVYEKQLRVRYCIILDLASASLQVLQHAGGGYEPVPADVHGRCSIPELEMKLGLFSGWVRFWHHDRLLPIAEEQDEQLQEKDLLIYEQTAQIQDQIATIGQQRQELAAIQERLRQRVDHRARAAARQDILHQLDGTVPIEQLELWLDELGG